MFQSWHITSLYPLNKMTGPTVYSRAIINEVHRELFNNKINHNEINKDNDITYKSKNVSYRRL